MNRGEEVGNRAGRETIVRGKAVPSPRVMVCLVLAAAAVFGLALVWIIPPWQSPDEPTHFEYAKVLALGGSPLAPRPDPVLQEEIIRSMDRHGYWGYVGVEHPDPLPGTFREAPFLGEAPTQIGKNPPLYYYLASLVLRSAPGESLEAGLYRLRLLSLFFTILTVILVVASAREVFGGDSPLVVVAAAAAAFLPQFLVIGTSVSSDPAINLVGAAVICLTLRWLRTGFSPARTGLVLGLIGLGIMVNYKGLILLAVLPAVWLIHRLSGGRRSCSLVRAAVRTGLVAGILAVGYVALVWYFPELARVFIVRVNIFCTTVVDFILGRTGFPPGYWARFHGEFFKSFWLKYGWLKFELPVFLYWFLAAVSTASLLGVIFFLAQSAAGRGSPLVPNKGAVATLILFAAGALGAVYLFWGLKAAPAITQGRHLFLVMPAWGILFTLGWVSLFPARRARTVGWALLGGFFILTAASILFFILPTFS